VLVMCMDTSTGEVQSEHLEGCGDFVFYGVAPGVHSILVQPFHTTQPCFERKTSPGEPPLDIRIECDAIPSIRIMGKVAWNEGEMGELRIVPFGPGLEHSRQFHRTRPDGTFEIGQFLPGDWRIEVRRGQTRQVLSSTKSFYVGPNETLDLGVLDLTQKSSATLR